MKCTEARDRILAADLSDLEGAGDAALRDHLDGCPACSAAADHVVSSTSSLRQALIARGARRPEVPARSKRSRVQRVLLTQLPLVMAAGIGAVAFVNQREAASPIHAPAPLMDDSVITVAPVVVEPVESRRSVETAAAPTAADMAPTHRDSAPDSAAKASDSTSHSPAINGIQVTPTGRGQRVAVIGTSNPKITVIWLTKGDSL